MIYFFFLLDFEHKPLGDLNCAASCIYLNVCFAAHGQGVLQRHREDQNYWQHIHGSCGPRTYRWYQGDMSFSCVFAHVYKKM